jgi:hypothetical protein
MGGPGSGSGWHWWRPKRKTTVEECFSLDVGKLLRRGFLRAGQRCVGTWSWPLLRSGGWFVADIEADALDPTNATARLRHRSLRGPLDYTVRLTTTSPRFGGLRFWFTCPLTVNGRRCGRRVGKLYLPLGAPYFGCRACHQLTYRSCQESHKNDALFRLLARETGMDPNLFRLLERPDRLL